MIKVLQEIGTGQRAQTTGRHIVTIDDEFEKQVMEEIAPILETVAQIRQVDHTLEKESVKVKKQNITEIVENIKKDRSKKHARQKARRRIKYLKRT